MIAPDELRQRDVSSLSVWAASPRPSSVAISAECRREMGPLHPAGLSVAPPAAPPVRRSSPGPARTAPFRPSPAPRLAGRPRLCGASCLAPPRRRPERDPSAAPRRGRFETHRRAGPPSRPSANPPPSAGEPAGATRPRRVRYRSRRSFVRASWPRRAVRPPAAGNQGGFVRPQPADPERGRDLAYALAAWLDRPLLGLENAPDTLDRACCLRETRAGEHERELLAPEPRDLVLPADVLEQDVGEQAQQTIAHEMAETVVDLLEFVDVGEREAKGVAGPLRLRRLVRRSRRRRNGDCRSRSPRRATPPPPPARGWFAIASPGGAILRAGLSHCTADRASHGCPR